MQTNILRSKIIAAGYNQSTLSKALGMSKNTLSWKINGKTAFNCDEVIKICSLLDIRDDSEKALIFLTGPTRKWDNQKGGTDSAKSDVGRRKTEETA